MGGHWNVFKVLLLLALVVIGVFVAVQYDTVQALLIENRKLLRGQSQSLQELEISQKRLQTQMKSLSAKFQSGRPRNLEVAPETVSKADGRILAHGRNCLLDPESVPLAFPDAQESGTLKLLLRTELSSLNGLLDDSADLVRIGNLVKASLYSRWFMEDGEKWYGVLAQELKVTDDYKVYTVKLRPDFYWHQPAVDLNDGRFKWLKDLGLRQVTAHDFVFTMKVVMDPDSLCASTRTGFEKFERIEALDDFTLRIVWKEKTFPSRAFSSLGFVVPQHIFGRYEDGTEIPDDVLGAEFNKHWYNDKIIGCGPYRFVSYEPGKKIVLERDNNYPLKHRPNFKRVEWHIVSSPDQQLARFKNGDLDYMEMTAGQYKSEILAVSGDPAAEAQSPFFNGRFRWQMVETPGYSYVAWNQSRALFKDPRVRRALTHAMPIRKMLKDVWLGFGEIITGPVHKFSPDYDPSLPPLEFDLEKAAALLDEAGWHDHDGNGIREKTLGNGEKQELSFEVVHFSPMPEYDQMFATYAKELLKIGVRGSHKGLDWPNLLKRMEERDFDGLAAAWMLGYDTDPYSIWHSSQADNPKGNNQISFRNAEVDQIIEEARETFDPQKRQQLFRRFHRIIYEEQPLTIWRARKVVKCWNGRIGGLRFDTRRPQTNPIQWWDLQITPQ